MLSQRLIRSSYRYVPLQSQHSQHRKLTSTITELQAAFRDPSSPFHIPPGSVGPESPDSPPTHATFGTLSKKTTDPSEHVAQSVDEGKKKLIDAGFDPESFWEQHIVWGDQDAFQHVNNVRYIRFFESARIKWMISLGRELGGLERARAMIKGEGLSLILKSIDVSFRRPVTYPDTLLIGYRPLPPATPTHDTATFHVQASAYSLNQKAFVAHSKEALVWYDYDMLKKCDPGEKAKEVLRGRIRKP